MKKRYLQALAVVCVIFGLGFLANAEGPGRLYVVGAGPAGPDLAAPRALSIIKKADFYLCSPRLPERFAKFGEFIDPAKVAFDPWDDVFDDEDGKKDPQARKAAREKQRKKVQDFVMEKIKEGKTVAMIDGGDPCVYGPTLNYLLKGLDDRHYEVVPGMGAFNAASAALKRSVTCDDSRFVMLTSPKSLLGDENETGSGDDILKDISKYKTTMVFYMSLKSLGGLVAKLKTHFPPDLPFAVVYYAGYEDKEKVVRSTLAEIEKDLENTDEKWLGLVVIGECVR